MSLRTLVGTRAGGRQLPFLLAFAVAIVASAAAPPAPAAAATTRTVLFRTGFEDGIGGEWRRYVAVDGRIRRVTSPVASGEYAVRFSSTSTSGSQAYMRRTVSPSGDLRFVASFNVRVESARGVRLPLMRLRASDGRHLASVLRTSGSGALTVLHDGRVRATTGRVPLGSWRRVSLRAVPSGTSSRVEVRVDDSLVYATRTAALGDRKVGVLQLGNDRAGRRSSVVVDRVAATVATTPTGTTTTKFVFAGRGTDHGVGLNQYGAYGRALAGQSYRTILAHYYRGTRIGTVDPAVPMRVRVVQGYRVTVERPAPVYGRSGPFTVAGVAKTFPADAAAVLRRDGSGWRLEVVDASGAKLHEAASAGDVTVRPASSATRLQVAFKSSRYNLYRGSVRVQATSSGLNATNTLGLDDYLLGVVASEMPSSWPQEALRAQAIAARSYAYVHRRPASSFDVWDDERSQVYLGVRNERVSSTASVRDTGGAVATYDGRVANTLFFSTGGGATEHNENVFTSSSGRIVSSAIPYLRGSKDVDANGRPYDSASGWANWTSDPFTMSQLSAVFSRDSRTNVGTLSRLDMSRRGVSGRLISVTLVGSGGTKTVSGLVFKRVFNAYRPGGPALKSTLLYLKPAP